jgi:hypothetical protein
MIKKDVSIKAKKKKSKIILIAKASSQKNLCTSRLLFSTQRYRGARRRELLT